MTMRQQTWLERLFASDRFKDFLGVWVFFFAVATIVGVAVLFDAIAQAVR